jgi:hypothetical protein
MHRANPLVGCTADSRRTAKVGKGSRAIHLGPILAAARKPPSPNLANFPDPSSGADCGHRFFHSADGDLPGPEDWTRQQMGEAFPWDQAPPYLLHDRDAICGRDFADLTPDMGMEEVLTAPRSPWQNPYVENNASILRLLLRNAIYCRPQRTLDVSGCPQTHWGGAKSALR